VFSEILTLLIADYGRRASSETFMLKHGQGGANNDVARLAGSRLVIASETEKGRRLNENLVKDMVSGDTVTARFLYEEAFEFTPTHKIWMYGNHKPTITGDDFGIWRRMRLIPFDVIIPEVKRDPRLPEKLRDELPGILAWAVRGAIEWYKNGLMTPSAVMRATDKYRDEQDALGEWIDEACIEHVDARVNTKAFYNAYIAYCDAAGERPIKKKDFNDRVVKKGFIRGKFAGYWHYFGIGLANQEGQAEMKV